MNTLELTPRLHMVAAAIPPCTRVADVGTDHAYLPVWLLQHGIAAFAIAADLRPGPLERAGETVRRYGLEAQIDLRLCDGLAGIAPHEADVIAIAGMGGETISGILQAAPWTKQHLCVLQPMSKQAELRAWLIAHGYCIVHESICREGDKLYISLTARGGMSEPYPDAALHAGWQSKGMHAPLRGAYLDSRIEKTARALAGVRRADGQGQRAKGLEALLDGLRTMKKEWDTWQQDGNSTNT